MTYWLAVTLLEHAEQTTGLDSGKRDSLLATAHGIFQELRAQPWLDRIDRIKASA